MFPESTERDQQHEMGSKNSPYVFDTEFEKLSQTRNVNLTAFTTH